MCFYTPKGCCGSTLQRTSLIIGVVFVIIYIISTTFKAIYHIDISISLPFLLACGILSIIASACLILAAILEIKYLCIPWCVVIGANFFGMLIWTISVILEPDRYKFKNELVVISVAVAAELIYIVVAFVLLRYVLSYFKLLGGTFEM